MLSSLSNASNINASNLYAFGLVGSINFPSSLMYFAFLNAE